MARGRIGPKVQTQVNPAIKRWIQERVRPGVKEADVVRELIEAGYAAKAEA